MSEEMQAPSEPTEESKPSWLATIEHVCVYRCQNGHESVWAGIWEEKPATLPCDADDCYHDGEYMRFEPVRLGGYQKVAYTQNGRHAYMIKTPDGRIQYRSKTKDVYLQSSGATIKDFHTKDYKEKTTNEEVVNHRRAKVETAKAKEAWKDARDKAKRKM